MHATAVPHMCVAAVCCRCRVFLCFGNRDPTSPMRSSASRERTQAGQFLRTTQDQGKCQVAWLRAGQEEPSGAAIETEAVAEPSGAAIGTGAVADMAPLAGRAKALAGLAEAMAGSAPQRKRRTPLESARDLRASGCARVRRRRTSSKACSTISRPWGGMCRSGDRPKQQEGSAQQAQGAILRCPSVSQATLPRRWPAELLRYSVRCDRALDLGRWRQLPACQSHLGR